MPIFSRQIHEEICFLSEAARICPVNTPNMARYEPNAQPFPKQGENCFSPSDALIEFDLRTGFVSVMDAEYLKGLSLYPYFRKQFNQMIPE